MSNPRLAAGVRLGFDHARGGPVLLAPESVTTLNDSGAAIVRLCDGTRTADEIVAVLRDQWDDVDAKEVKAFLRRLAALRCLTSAPGGADTGAVGPDAAPPGTAPSKAAQP